jgi:hypothetical protein
LKLCDAWVEAVDNLTERTGFELIVSVEEQDERRPGLVKAK